MSKANEVGVIGKAQVLHNPTPFCAPRKKQKQDHRKVSRGSNTKLNNPGSVERGGSQPNDTL